MRRLAIIGASGHGKSVGDVARDQGWEEITFFDERFPEMARAAAWCVRGRLQDYLDSMASFDGVIVAIGDCRVRHRVHEQLVAAGARLNTIVHSRAWVSPGATIGPGSVLMAGAIVNIDSRLGPATIVNTGATIDHDCTLGTAVHIAPGTHLSGNVSVGDLSWIGVGACVRQGIRIGSGVLVGAGAVVVSDVADGLTVIGSPARPRSPSS